MKKTICFLCVSFVCIILIGQNLNFGLHTPQKPGDLPVSKAPFQKAVRKTKVETITTLQQLSFNEYQMNSGWKLQEGNEVIASGKSIFEPELNTSNWYNATVPGTVLTTLVDQGVYPDPYWGLNNLSIPESLCRTDWWYRIAFEIPQDQKEKACRLLFNGINYRADVWLNGQLLGRINGAFQRGTFLVNEQLNKNGKNILAVHILPPPNPGIPHEENKTEIGPNGGQLCLDGPTFISSEGWDWIPGIRDRNIGIWQDVRLIFGSEVYLQNPQIITRLEKPSYDKAYVSIITEIKNEGTQVQNLELKGVIGNINFSKTFSVKSASTEKISLNPDEIKSLIIQNPRLWWPNGYGKPELYMLELSLLKEGKIVDQKKIRFGIREMSYELMVDATEQKEVRIEYTPLETKQKGKPLFDFANRHEFEKNKNAEIGRLRDGINLDNFKILESRDNPFLVIKVNGKPIFCKGGNWGMDDGMKRVEREHLEPYFKLHQKENFNMVRNWTGESTEEVFYDLCDEYGMLIWNDFSMSTEGYNIAPLDETLFLQNVKEIVLRFRNHPSIAVWCPRNEGYAPVGLEDGIQNIIAAEDGTRLYHGNSRRMNMPWSGPWHYFNDPKEYYTKVAQGFNSELGTLSVPTAETMRKFMAPEDLWPIGDVWYYHDLHYSGHEWKTYLSVIDKLGTGPANSLDDFCKRAQVLNYNAHRDMFESWNHRMWDNTSGLLLWMSHPAWPSLIWQTYSYDYETHGSFFGCKKACEPIHIQWNHDDNKIVAINATLADYQNAQVVLQVLAVNGKELLKKEQKINVVANNKTDAFIANIPDFKQIVLVRLSLKDVKGNLLSQNEYWLNGVSRTELSPLASIPKVNLSASKIRLIKDSVVYITATIKNSSTYIATGVKLNIADVQTNSSILPVYASDGYFNLLPGEAKPIDFEMPVNKASSDMFLKVSGFNVDEANLGVVK